MLRSASRWASPRDGWCGRAPSRPTTPCRAACSAARPPSAADVWRTVRRDASAHPSPNAGVAEAAFAAALGLRLGGVVRYGERVEHRPHLGVGRAAAAADIARAVHLSDDVTLALA